MDKTLLKTTTVTIPTYGIGESPTTPIFYEGRANQGAQGHVYPYALQDTLSESKSEREWKCVVLENEYVHYEILPDLGGRIFRAVDKTNGYDFFYKQEVVKPALIGVLGAWMSGGVEWNFPHHHRTTTFMPAEWRVEEDESDGSATVWIGETEHRHRMRSEVGLCLRPGTSCLEVKLVFVNETSLPQSFLYWANAAVHANEQYQVIFPPDVYYGIHHAKDVACTWPMFDGDYKGIHFDKTDLSWWKNHPAPTSIFCGKTAENFFGGYDHGKDAGVVIWADRHEARGKKFFLWGNNAYARVWDQILTDVNGPYLELMAGAFSDNQPDYTWLQPYETKTATQYFYPVRGLGGFTHASRQGAVNVVEKDGGLDVSVLATRAVDAVLRMTLDGRVEELACSVGPDKVFKHRFEGIAPDFATFELVAAGESEPLFTYDYVKKYPERPMPTLTVPPGKPETFGTVEELYLAGQRLEQFHNPILSCEPYYEEALKRDPSDYRTNLAVGVRLAKRGLWADAEACFRKALARAEYNNTTPQDGTAYYLLGVSLKAQEKDGEAYDMFRQAMWYPSVSYCADKELCDLKGLATTWDRAANYALCEPEQHALNLACACFARRDWSGALDVLPSDSNFPLIQYYRGYAFARLGDDASARQAFAAGMNASTAYCYPFRWETENVLRKALEFNPKDCQAYYYLGCLLRYFERKDEALASWEAASNCGSKVGDLYYCLAHAYEKATRYDEAKAMYERAMVESPMNPLYVREFDKFMELRKVPAGERLAFLRERKDVVRLRDDVLLREIVLLNSSGDYDGALALLGDRRFYVWEGNEVIVHDSYADAHLKRGIVRLEAGDFADARKDFEDALLYPVKLGVGRPYRDIRCRMTYYWIGLSYKGEGRLDEARKAFEESVADVIAPSTAVRLCLADVPYCQALSMLELGRVEDAKAQLEAIVANSKKQLGDGAGEADFFAKFNESAGGEPMQKKAVELLQKATATLSEL